MLKTNRVGAVHIKVLAVAFLLLPAISFSDESGTFEQSMQKYPEIMEILNSDLDEDDYIFVDMNMPNDGISKLTLKNGSQLLLVNFQGKYAYRGSAFFEVKNGKYRRSTLAVPYAREIEIGGDRYSLHNDRTDIQKNRLIVTYSPACKLPASYIEIGGCSDDEMATAILSYKYQKGEFILVDKTLERE
ncbi:hypothetical protein ACVW0Y_004432 [Pseudomonas sp. TE3786]